MADEKREKILRLLQPTHDTEGWLAEVRSLDPAGSIPLIVEVMNDESQPMRTRGQAASLLGELRDGRAVAPLVRALESSREPVVRAQAALSLAQIGGPAEVILPALTRGLGDADYFVRECAAKALALLKSPEAVPALEAMRAADDVPTNREVAARALESIRGGEE